MPDADPAPGGGENVNCALLQVLRTPLISAV